MISQRCGTNSSTFGVGKISQPDWGRARDTNQSSLGKTGISRVDLPEKPIFLAKSGRFVPHMSKLAAISESRQALGHPEGNPGANIKSISHRCHPILLAFVWELTEETIKGCLKGGERTSPYYCRRSGGRHARPPCIRPTGLSTPLEETGLLFLWLRLLFLWLRVRVHASDASVLERVVKSQFGGCQKSIRYPRRLFSKVDRAPRRAGKTTYPFHQSHLTESVY